jgi:hypothetical protein
MHRFLAVAARPKLASNVVQCFSTVTQPIKSHTQLTPQQRSDILKESKLAGGASTADQFYVIEREIRAVSYFCWGVRFTAH